MDTELGKRLPLNSRRLKTTHLRQIRKALDLPTLASVDKIHGLIEGKLAESGRQPMNVQVTIGDDSSLTLSYEDGAFLSVKAPEREHKSPSPRDVDDLPDDSTLETQLRLAESNLSQCEEKLKEAQDHIKAQEAEITLLRGQLDSEKARIKEMWRLN